MWGGDGGLGELAAGPPEHDVRGAKLRRSSEQYKQNIQKEKGRVVLGLSSSAAAKAWTFDHLAVHDTVNDTFRGETVPVLYHRQSGTAQAYRAQIDGRHLTFWHGRRPIGGHGNRQYLGSGERSGNRRRIVRPDVDRTRRHGLQDQPATPLTFASKGRQPI